jgi:ABC-2 type transport system permease protein
MPKAVQFITYFIPARYYIFILRGLFLKGAGLNAMRVDSAFLLCFAFMMLALATRKFKKKVF